MPIFALILHQNKFSSLGNGFVMLFLPGKNAFNKWLVS